MDLSAVPMSPSAAIFFEQVSHQSLVVHLQANKTDFQKLFEKLWKQIGTSGLQILTQILFNRLFKDGLSEMK